MRLHKKNTKHYESFYKYVQNNDEKTGHLSTLSINPDSDNDALFEKESYFFKLINNFTRAIRYEIDINQISDLLKSSIKKIITTKDTALLSFEENPNELLPLTNTDKGFISDRLNHYNKEGILNIIFESKKVMMLPELSSYDSEGPKFNYFIFPFYENDKKKGLFAILTNVNQKKLSLIENDSIYMLIDLAVNKIYKIKSSEKLRDTYEELQTYQAKLSNDFRLAAIGELTDGIVEDIMTPLQVIISHVDILDQENEENQEIKKIKNQVSKINAAVNRIVKFSNLNQRDIKIQPFNLNEIINDYYNLVKSTIASLNLELVMDFDKNLPSILTHPSYIYQLLTNLIGIVKNRAKNNGGILIQTRYGTENIVVRLISTANLTNYLNPKGKKVGKTIDLNTRIVENLMTKHEGKFTIESYSENSSTINLYFPLIRKNRI